MPKRFLYVSDYAALAYQVQGKVVQHVAQFFPNSENQSDFIHYLTTNPKTPIVFLLDTSQEGYYLLQLPHVGGKDRQELLNHKIKRLFEHASYTYNVVQGREQQGRGDDKVLFMALNNANILQPWLNLITTHKVPLMGIYSFPLLKEVLLKSLPKASYTLLVMPTPQWGEQNTFGLRQSFFVHQRLHFSRLVPLATSTLTTYPETVAHQITKTQRYLETSKLLPVNESLTVIILANTVHFSALQDFFQQKSAEVNVHILDTQDIARQLGGYYVEESLYSHHLLIYLLSKKLWMSNHYAKPLETRYLQHHWIQTGLYFTSVLFLVGSVLGSAMIFHEASTIKQQGERHAERIAQRQAELEKLGRELPVLPFEVQLIRNVVDVGRYLSSLHVFPRPILEKLSQVLTRHERLFVEGLEWGVGNSREEAFSLQKSEEEQLPEQQESSRKRNRRFGKLSKKSPPPTHFLEAIRIHGRIDPFENYREALHLFNEFVKDLRQQPHAFSEVKELQAPYNPEETLQGQIGSSQDEKVITAPFSVEVVVQHAYQLPSLK